MREGRASRTAEHNALFRALEARRPAGERVVDERRDEELPPQVLTEQHVVAVEERECALTAAGRKDLRHSAPYARKIPQQVEHQDRCEDEVSEDREPGLETAAHAHRRFPGGIQSLQLVEQELPDVAALEVQRPFEGNVADDGKLGVRQPHDLRVVPRPELLHDAREVGQELRPLRRDEGPDEGHGQGDHHERE